MVALTALGLVIAGVGIVIAYQAYVSPKPPKIGTSRAERAPYINQVEGLCYQAGLEFQALGPIPDGADLNQYADYYGRMNQIVEQLSAGWAVVPMPPGDEPTVISILAFLERAISETNEVIRAADAGDLDLVDTLVDRQRDIVAALREQTAKYGFNYCSKLFRSA